MSRRSACFGVAAIMAVLVVAGSSMTSTGEVRRSSEDGFSGPFYRKLAEVRQQRKARVAAYFADVRRLAEGIARDTVMMEAFQKLRGSRRTASPGFDLSLDIHYVNRYSELFDILLVDRSGYVFHSLRRESDYHQNLFSGALAKTKLARHLRGVDKITFIDYEFYPPSDELAAFFAVPVFDPQRVAARSASENAIGWFVLQIPLNKVNSILSDRRGLGRTGEAYCVNAEQQMVTPSRFRPESTNLRLRVETLAVSEALASGTGQRSIRDYRGVRVLSSFEPFDVYGTKWAIIAEFDEDEAITEHYRQDVDFYTGGIVRELARFRIQSHPRSPGDNGTKRVDMNEFAKAVPGAALSTNGVATCTAIAINLPGRFGYLAHIGPSDRIYGKPDVGHNDCLGEMLRRVLRHDMYPYELPKLRFTIVAAHDGGLAGAIDQLTQDGIGLAQIRFAFNPRADYANVVLAPGEASVRIEWNTSAGSSSHVLATDYQDLGSIVKRLAAQRRK